ncbi:MAG: MotA/TolQ/ExbB proton channel family protein [Leptospiraceae bacterium]|nr:MotA/TolQ/ExbB proton channel family protein [Leptospiraceae bacterium]MDW7975806.1 MotA/TolQ/ExbB proton channel family protein [Leptospiraceae bacterium]
MDWKFYFIQGGPVVWFLMFLFLVVIIIMIERYLFYKSYQNFTNLIKRKLQENKIDISKTHNEISTLLTYEKIPYLKNWFSVFNHIEEYLKSSNSLSMDVEELKKQLIYQDYKYLERYLIYLATLGNLSPFIGLLGTVLGIIRSFANLGDANIQEINKGIAEALVATALGLLVAIPSSFGYNLFRKKVDDIISDIDYIFSLLKQKR